MNLESTLLAANAAYYDAFARCDLDAMAALWADDGVSCVHPGWPPILGRERVLTSYKQIFANPHQEPVRHRCENFLLGEDGGRVFCMETVGETALAATNWFRRIDSRWRLTHHQASLLAFAPRPEEPTTTRH